MSHTHKPAKAIMIQGTMSNVGKSLLTAGLCRIFRQDGYRVAPFKSQNMALNSFITRDGLEMGRAQVVQCEAAGIEPSVLMNPILLKPTSDQGSQVIVHGESIGNLRAADYFSYKRQLIPEIQKAYYTLAQTYDIIVLEGAGSPAEINLKQDDIVNMGMAKLARAPVLLAGDIDRGGVFASLYGTLALLEEDERALVKGCMINKFRGDPALLEPGLRQLEELTQVPVLGVLPYLSVDLDAEDSLSHTSSQSSAPPVLDLAVIRLPRISNFTDFHPLEWVDGVRLRYVSSVSELGNPDLIFLPGTKNTMGDLRWMRENGLEAAIKKLVDHGTPLFGICGGYQMLGEILRDPEQVEMGGEIEGMGLLPMETVFSPQKVRRQATGRFTDDIEGVLSPMQSIPCEGYEIHMGVSHATSPLPPLLHLDNGTTEGAQKGLVYGTYLHGIFDREEVTRSFLSALLQKKGLSFPQLTTFDARQHREAQYDQLAASMREHLDLPKIYAILEAGI